MTTDPTQRISKMTAPSQNLMLLSSSSSSISTDDTSSEGIIPIAACQVSQTHSVTSPWHHPTLHPHVIAHSSIVTLTTPPCDQFQFNHQFLIKFSLLTCLDPNLHHWQVHSQGQKQIMHHSPSSMTMFLTLA